MAKRRKDIMKRKKLQEEQVSVSPAADEGPGEPKGAEPEDLSPPEREGDVVPQPRPERSKGPDKGPEPGGWLTRNKENLLLGFLVLYVVLLGLGTAGELFEIEWILNLPIFR